MSNYRPLQYWPIGVLIVGSLLLESCIQNPLSIRTEPAETSPAATSERRAEPTGEQQSKAVEVPTYDEDMGSTFNTTGETSPGSESELTARALQIRFETRAPFDDPSHHGALFSSEPLFSREELESADRALVSVPKELGERPVPIDLTHSNQRFRMFDAANAADLALRDFDGSCLRAGCHQSYAERRWVHGPVAVGSCDTCHVPAEQTTEEHQFELTRPNGRLCAECHEHSEPEKYRHSGYSDADCVKCHDPHGGSNKFYLVSLDQRLMCGQCHGSAALATGQSEFAPLHSPVAEMRCLSCHFAHRSDYEAVTIAPKRELCMQCHEKFVEQFPASLTLHEPVITDCGACHLPHGGQSHMIRSRSQDLCLGCHQKIALALEQDPQLHSAIKEIRSCLDCHVPHASYTASLLKGRVGGTCITCHNEVIKAESGEEIQNIKELLLTRNFRHAPALEGQCQECHISHTRNDQKLLSVRYPMQLYATGVPDTYALCMKCHDERLLTEEDTTATRFRDGTRNLHRAHVVQKKSRTCNTCHEVHAGDLPSLMRKSFQFGASGWIIELGFEKTETGGACGANCHQAMGYANVEPPGPPISVKSRLGVP